MTVVGGLGQGGGFYWLPTSGIVPHGRTAGAVHEPRRQHDRGRSPRCRQAAAGRASGRAARSGGCWDRSSPMPGRATPTLSTAIQTSARRRRSWWAWRGTRCDIARAFRWEESTGMVNLGSTVAGRSSRADAVSGDGKVVVGFQELTTGFWQGARWVGGPADAVHGPARPGRPGVRHEPRRVDRRGPGVPSGRPRDQSGWVWTPARRRAVPARPEARGLAIEGELPRPRPGDERRRPCHRRRPCLRPRKRGRPLAGQAALLLEGSTCASTACPMPSRAG